MLHVSVSAYKQAVAERKSDPIFQKVGGRGIVDGDVLEVFWSYFSEVGFIKVPRNYKHSSLSAWSVLA